MCKSPGRPGTSWNVYGFFLVFFPSLSLCCNLPQITLGHPRVTRETKTIQIFLHFSLNLKLKVYCEQSPLIPLNEYLVHDNNLNWRRMQTHSSFSRLTPHFLETHFYCDFLTWCPGFQILLSPQHLSVRSKLFSFLKLNGSGGVTCSHLSKLSKASFQHLRNQWIVRIVTRNKNKKYFTINHMTYSKNLYILV